MTSQFSVPKVDFSRFPIPTKPFIDGKIVDSRSSERQTLRSSLNDEIVTTELQWSNAEDVELAVEAAERGLVAWQALSVAERRDILLKYSKLIRQRQEELNWLEAISVGKDARMGAFEADLAANMFVYFANMMEEFEGGEVKTSSDDTLQYTLHQPWGVCAGILPFNAPLMMLSTKVAPALACGNSIVLKASETNPFSSILAASLATEAGVPPGVINLVTGGAEVGNALALHMRIRKISFTGSIGVGKLVTVAAAKSNLKSVTLELGGKSPVIVFPDADLDKVAEHISSFLTLNGQGCLLGTRVYLHRSIADEVIANLKAIVEKHAENLGSDPSLATTHSSPLFHKQQLNSVLSFMESGKKEATLITGGSRLGETGCYVEPTIFVDPKPDARVLKDEVFGPVLTIVRFDDEDQVTRLANDSEYGLSASVHTKDFARALRVSRRLEAGTVNVNTSHRGAKHAPFGGWKQSGQGVEMGKEAMHDWSQIKVVSMM